jgi:hypothetical protein
MNPDPNQQPTPLPAPASAPAALPPTLAAAMQKTKVQTAGRELLKHVRRLELSYPEYRIAQLILELSYGWGLRSVLVPKLEILSVLDGMVKSHISTTLHSLEEIGLLLIEKTPFGPRYSITTNPQLWRCRLKGKRAQVREAINTLKVYNKIETTPANNEDSQGSPHFFNPQFDAKNFDAGVPTDGTRIPQTGTTSPHEETPNLL